jgi:hypothetical protein
MFARKENYLPNVFGEQSNNAMKQKKFHPTKNNLISISTKEFPIDQKSMKGLTNLEDYDDTKDIEPKPEFNSEFNIQYQPDVDDVGASTQFEDEESFPRTFKLDLARILPECRRRWDDLEAIKPKRNEQREDATILETEEKELSPTDEEEQCNLKQILVDNLN